MTVESYGEMVKRAYELTYCTTCLARKGYPCRTLTSGSKSANPHAARFQALKRLDAGVRGIAPRHGERF